MELKNPYFNIPVSLIRAVLNKKQQAPFALYLILKAHCSGRIQYEDIDWNAIRERLNYKSEKSVHNNYKKLLKLNWIGFDPKTHTVYVRGFEYMMDVYDCFPSMMSLFSVYTDIDVEAFLYGSVYGYLAKRAKASFTKKAARKKYRTPYAAYQAKEGFQPVSLRCFTSQVKVAKSTASAWKNKAKQQLFINVKENYEILPVDNEDELKLYRLCYAEDLGLRKIEHKQISGKYYYVIRDCDLIRCERINFKYRKKQD